MHNSHNPLRVKQKKLKRAGNEGSVVETFDNMNGRYTKSTSGAGLAIVVGLLLIVFVIGFLLFPFFMDSDEFEGIVMEISVDSFTLFIPVDDPEAEAPAYIVEITERTSFSGSINSLDDLEEGDSVRVEAEPGENGEVSVNNGKVIASEVIGL